MPFRQRWPYSSNEKYRLSVAALSANWFIVCLQMSSFRSSETSQTVIIECQCWHLIPFEFSTVSAVCCLHNAAYAAKKIIKNRENKRKWSIINKCDVSCARILLYLLSFCDVLNLVSICVQSIDRQYCELRVKWLSTFVIVFHRKPYR